MKATDILHRLNGVIQQIPSSRRHLVAAVAVAGVVGAGAGFVLPRLMSGAPERSPSANYATEQAAPAPNRETKEALPESAPRTAEALGQPGETVVEATASTASARPTPAPAPPQPITRLSDQTEPEIQATPQPQPQEAARTEPVKIATVEGVEPTSATLPAASGPAAPLVPAVSESEQRLAAAAPPVPQRPAPHGAAPFNPTTPLAPADPKEIAAALAPVLARQASAEDLQLLKETTKALQKEDYDGAKALYSRLQSKTVRKLAYWYYLKSANVNAAPSEIASFRSANPLWPGRETLDERAERTLVLHSAPPQETFEYFRGRQPTSGPGKAALGAALIARGEKDRGARLIREAWRQHVLDEELETKVLERFGALLTDADHRHRADFLSLKSKRSKVVAVNRHQARPGKPQAPEPAAQAARSPSRLLARIQQLRKQDKHQEAWALLRGAPMDAGGAPADWWVERRLQARNALNRGQPRVAYAIVLGHGPLDAEAQAEAGFMAGWIALRFLNDPATAKQHLAGATHAGGLPKDLARSYYWLARAEMALNHKQDAHAHFSEAARYQHTFYGQLARTALTAIGAGPQVMRVSLRSPARPSQEDIRAFQDMDTIDAMLIARQAGLDGIIPLFLNDLARRVDSPGLLTLVAEFGQRVAHPHVNVRFAKVALNRGFPLEHYAYPAALPQFHPLVDNARLDHALLHALTRQESEFNAETVSSANARGLMQLLPGTAKQMCQAYGVRFDVQKLTGDPAYNVSLGSAYLYKVLDDYSGSYIMALASYNAGPGRVREWIGMFGDPRDPKVDPIDWVERIPFTETRDYVHKIMESVQLYRARLGGRDGPLMLVDDLYRGRPRAGR